MPFRHEASMTHASLRWSSAAATDVGHVRRINEDASLNHSERGLWAVADGMGGHAMGDFASRMIVEALGQITPAGNLEDDMRLVDECLLNVNEALREEAANRHAEVIGSTAVVLLARGNHCGYLWAGDSRLYLYRDDKLLRLTRDHSQVEELLAGGLLTPEQAANYPGRNFITRAVGAFDTLDIDTGIIEVQSEDVYLLCSDGLTNEVNEESIGRLLKSGKGCQQIADALIDAALRQGGRDNVTAVVIRAETAQAPQDTPPFS
jgi:protein phosphatase